MLPEDAERRIAELERENRQLRIAVNGAIEPLRCELTIREVNEAIRSLNAVLPKEERVPDYSWGTPTLSKLRQATKELCHLLSLKDHEILLGDRLK